MSHDPYPFVERFARDASPTGRRGLCRAHPEGQPPAGGETAREAGLRAFHFGLSAEELAAEAREADLYRTAPARGALAAVVLVGSILLLGLPLLAKCAGVL
jgi:hypothetical protein